MATSLVPVPAPVTAGSVSLEKFTPGRLALADAITVHDAGVKFVSVRHVHGFSIWDDAAEVLSAGGGMLMTGPVTGADYARCWAVIDGMISRGVGHFAVVTQSPENALSVVRYVARAGRLYPVADWIEQQYGPRTGEPLTGAGRQAYDAARLDRAEKDKAHIRRVEVLLNDRAAERARMKERAAARLASATAARTA